MIFDRLENAERYKTLDARIATALDVLQKTDFRTIEKGEYAIEGRDIFAIVNDYNLKPLSAGRLEAHRKYIDIQFLARGSEKIGYAAFCDQVETTPFDVEADVGFYAGDASLMPLDEGMFAIFYPDELHMPGIGEPFARARKVVLKVLA